MKLILAMVLTGLSSIAACDFGSQSATDVVNDLSVTYEAHIRPIMEAQCTGCHGSGQGGEGLDLTTYDQVSRRYRSIIRSIENNSMPISWPLTPLEKALLAKWKQIGYPEK